jgi:hypothetical protein
LAGSETANAPEYSRSERRVAVNGSVTVVFSVAVPGVASSGTATASLRAAGLLIAIQSSSF